LDGNGSGQRTAQVIARQYETLLLQRWSGPVCHQDDASVGVLDVGPNMFENSAQSVLLFSPCVIVCSGRICCAIARRGFGRGDANLSQTMAKHDRCRQADGSSLPDRATVGRCGRYESCPSASRANARPNYRTAPPASELIGRAQHPRQRDNGDCAAARDRNLLFCPPSPTHRLRDEKKQRPAFTTAAQFRALSIPPAPAAHSTAQHTTAHPTAHRPRRFHAFRSFVEKGSV
jgi:hypothetical protein